MSEKRDHNARLMKALGSVERSLETGEGRQNVEAFVRRVVDIPALRERHGMTQQAFADAVGISVGTLRNWEQGRRSPEGAAQRLLEVIDEDVLVAVRILARGQSKAATQSMAGLTGERRDVQVVSRIAATKQVEEFTAEAQKTVEEGVEKMTKGVEEATEFGQGYMEALVASGKVLAKAAEEMNAEMAAFTKKSYQDSMAAAKELTSAKLVSEFFEKQTAYAKTSFEAYVAEATKLNEIYAAAAKAAAREDSVPPAGAEIESRSADLTKRD